MTPAVDAMVSPTAPLAAAMSGGVNIDIDGTIVVQIVLFSLLVMILKPLLFDPVLRIFEEREKRTDGARAEARDMQEEAGSLLRKYEQELVKVQQVAADERERLRAETAHLEAEIMGKARASTQQVVDNGRQQIESEVDKIRFELGRQSATLAQQIVSRAVGREVGS